MDDNKRIIPVHEPEVLEAIRKRGYDGKGGRYTISYRDALELGEIGKTPEPEKKTLREKFSAVVPGLVIGAGTLALNIGTGVALAKISGQAGYGAAVAMFAYTVLGNGLNEAAAHAYAKLRTDQNEPDTRHKVERGVFRIASRFHLASIAIPVALLAAAGCVERMTEEKRPEQPSVHMPMDMTPRPAPSIR